MYTVRFSRRSHKAAFKLAEYTSLLFIPLTLLTLEEPSAYTKQVIWKRRGVGNWKYRKYMTTHVFDSPVRDVLPCPRNRSHYKKNRWVEWKGLRDKGKKSALYISDYRLYIPISGFGTLSLSVYIRLITVQYCL